MLSSSQLPPMDIENSLLTSIDPTVFRTIHPSLLLFMIHCPMMWGFLFSFIHSSSLIIRFLLPCFLNNRIKSLLTSLIKDHLHSISSHSSSFLLFDISSITISMSSILILILFSSRIQFHIFNPWKHNLLSFNKIQLYVLDSSLPNQISLFDQALNVINITRGGDQHSMMKVYHKHNLKPYLLPNQQFCSGLVFFSSHQYSWDEVSPSIFMMHNNYVRGSICKSWECLNLDIEEEKRRILRIISIWLQRVFPSMKQIYEYN